jgi:hypothetical protein
MSENEQWKTYQPQAGLAGDGQWTMMTDGPSMVGWRWLPDHQQPRKPRPKGEEGELDFIWEGAPRNLVDGPDRLVRCPRCSQVVKVKDRHAHERELHLEGAPPEVLAEAAGQS